MEIQSREPTVREDLAAWCRVVGHGLVEVRERGGGNVSYFVRKMGGGRLVEFLVGGGVVTLSY